MFPDRGIKVIEVTKHPSLPAVSNSITLLGLVLCSLEVACVVTAKAVCGVCEKGAVNVFAMIKVPYD
tara:strand:- start:500 stop:700 length:201 start_codon:yes stop_codon:yes gene_type:complete